MIDLSIAVIAALIGYLFGSFSFARIIGKVVAPQEDITKTEFGVPGMETKVVMTGVSATSLSMRKGPKAGCTTSILDMLKVTAPTLVFKLMYPEAPYFLITAAAGVVGHNWPIYHRFVGGRGLSAIFGGLFIIDWLGILVPNVLGMIIGIALFQDVLLAYAAGTILLIPWLWWRTNDPWYVAYAVVVSTAFLIAMSPELRQYIKIKREGKAPDLKTTLATTDMGKGFEKMFAMFKSKQKS